MRRSRADAGSLGPTAGAGRRERVPLLPNGRSLPDDVALARHKLVASLLALHAPALVALGLFRGGTLREATVQAAAIPIGLALASFAVPSRRLQALLVTTGLVWCSSLLVHLSGEATEAQFHFFIIIGFLALYQDWVPFLWAIIGRMLGQVAVGAVAASMATDTAGGQQKPFVWAGINGAAVLSAGIAQVVLWRSAEREQQRASGLAAELVQAESASDRRRTQGELLVSLARRNQSLIQRQLELIDDLEQGERDPDVLDGLFRLDHLATRMRRNAESLLVLSGNEPGRRHGEPLPISEVVRGAVAEIEDFRRVDVVTAEDPSVHGRAVADLAHLLAELIENATAFSPPETRVVVAGQEMGGSYVLHVKDRGIGLTEQALHVRNRQLAEVPEDDLDLASMLGLHVVARLARRLGVRVTLERNMHGGTTATVVLLPALLTGTVGQTRRNRLAPQATTEGPRSSRPLAEALAALGSGSDGLGDDPTAGFDDPQADAVGLWWDEDAAAPAAPVLATPITPPPAPPAAKATPAAPSRRPAPPVASITWELPTDEDFEVVAEAAAAATIASTPVLARRVPQANLAPGLAAKPAPAEPEAAPDLYRPDEVRSRLQRLQQGVRHGRGEPVAAGAPGPADWSADER